MRLIFENRNLLSLTTPEDQASKLLHGFTLSVYCYKATCLLVGVLPYSYGLTDRFSTSATDFVYKVCEAGSKDCSEEAAVIATQAIAIKAPFLWLCNS